MAEGEAMRGSKERLIEQINFFENNAAWKWQIERLQSEVYTLKNVLIDAGILINFKGNIQQTAIIIDGQTYSIRKVK
jgi:hypothetical protein